MSEAAAVHDLTAEDHVIGACMLSAKAIDAVAELLAPADFYRATSGRIFQAVLDLYGRGEPVDAVTLAGELEREGCLEDVGGRARVNELAAIVPSTSNVGHYARLVREAATLRGLLRASAEIGVSVTDRDGSSPDALLDRAEGLILDLARARHRSDLIRPGDILADTLRELSAIQERGGGLIGLSTGLSDLDHLTAGLQRGNLIVLGARPSMGKSSAALGVAANAAVRLKLPVVFFTLEMSRREVMHRLLALEAHVDLHKMRTGKLSLEEWSRVHDAGDKVQAAPLFIDDAGAPTVLEIRSKARQLRHRHPDLALVVVDYLQLVAQDAENRVQEVSKISRALKVLAGELDVPVLALSQLNRQVEQRHDKRPMLSDLRESGSVEQDADVVVMLYRESVYFPEDPATDGVAELNVAKQRNGPTGVAKVYFEKRWAGFSTLDRTS